MIMAGQNSLLLWVRKNINHYISNTLPYVIKLNSSSYDQFKRKIIFSVHLFGYEYNTSQNQIKSMKSSDHKP